jgi:hypothetical protein
MTRKNSEEVGVNRSRLGITLTCELMIAYNEAKGFEDSRSHETR